MSIGIDHGGELYSLIVDKLGEVMKLPLSAFEYNPTMLDQEWYEISAGSSA